MHILVIIGGSIFVLLGLMHAIYTLQSSPSGGKMAPTNPATREAMTVEGGLGLAPGLQIPLWQAWVGFNLSHSIGAVLGGLLLVVPAWTDFDAALDHAGWLAVAFIVPALYLVLSIRYWFRDPTVGIALGTILVTLGVIGGLA